MLTASRLLLAPVLFVFISAGQWLWATAVFAAAVYTDVMDGRMARRQQRASAIGGIFDHATDATFVSIGLAALALSDFVTWWLVPLIPAAFVQYLLDSGTLSGSALRPSSLGRINGVGYFVLLGAVVIGNALQLDLLVLWRGLAWLLVLSTLASMSERLWLWFRLR